MTRNLYRKFLSANIKVLKVLITTGLETGSDKKKIEKKIESQIVKAKNAENKEPFGDIKPESFST